jgi:hypothetical protein
VTNRAARRLAYCRGFGECKVSRMWRFFIGFDLETPLRPLCPNAQNLHAYRLPATAQDTKNPLPYGRGSVSDVEGDWLETGQAGKLLILKRV